MVTMVDWPTIIGTLIGAGGLTTIILKIFDYKRSMSGNASKMILENFTLLTKRLEALELAEKACLENSQVMAMELGALRASNAGLKEELTELKQLKLDMSTSLLGEITELKNLNRQLQQELWQLSKTLVGGDEV
jgi:hypothetical protein